MATKVAIVTAASRGLGAATARELYKQGYQLVLMSPSGAKAIAKEINALSLSGSVSNDDDLKNLVDTTVDRYHRIDALVNFTGHASSGDILAITDEQWQQGLELIMLNVVRLTRLVTPIMLKQGKGAIVNGSTFAAFEPHVDFPVSSCLRAALAGFTKLYANRYAKKGIRINNVLPGFIDNHSWPSATVDTIPMKRAGKAAEVARTVAFLLSDDAGYITGQNLRIDGGLTHSL